MPDSVPLEAILQFAAAIFLALLPIAGAYIVNERSKQRAFERERKYDRKREHYETALTALRRAKDVRELWDVQAIDESALSTFPQDLRQKMLLFLPILKRLSAFLLEARFAESREELRKKRDLFAAPATVDESPTADTFVTFVHVYLNAMEDLERSVSGLKLLGAPDVITAAMGSIMYRVADSAAQPGKGNWDWFDDAVADLEETIRQDLQATIKGK